MSLFLAEAATESLETTAEAINGTSEVITESINLDVYDLGIRVSTSKVVLGIIGIVVIFAAIIGLIVFLNRKHKASGFALLGGAATYFVFYYFSLQAILMMLFYVTPLKKYLDTSSGVAEITSAWAYILPYGLVFGIIPILGRSMMNKVFATKSFDEKINNFAGNLSVSLGIAAIYGIRTTSIIFQRLSPMVIINRGGADALLLSGATQADADAIWQEIIKLVEYPTKEIVITTIIALIVIIYHVAITVPLYALHERKIKLTWYFLPYIGYTLIQLLQCMHEKDVINVWVQLAATLILVGVSIYISYIMYVKFYKSQQRDLKKEKEEREKKIQAAHKKMPKFENLSNL